MHDNSSYPDHDERLHRARGSTARQQSRNDNHGPRCPQPRPPRWGLVQVWNGALLATFGDEASAREAMNEANHDEVVVLHLRT
jgi:hypothetical protein